MIDLGDLCSIQIAPDNNFVGHFYLKIIPEVVHETEEYSLEIIFNRKTVFTNLYADVRTVLVTDKDQVHIVFRPNKENYQLPKLVFERIDIFQSHECKECIDQGNKICTL